VPSGDIQTVQRLQTKIEHYQIRTAFARQRQRPLPSPVVMTA
jgi:hypothetical protein